MPRDMADSEATTDRIRRALEQGWAVVPGPGPATLLAIEGARKVPRPTRRRAVYEIPRWLAEALLR